MELLSSGLPVGGVLEKMNLKRLPPCVSKYLFCSPAADFGFRCLPSEGGLYSQRYRDFVEFNIIENRLRAIHARKN